MIQTLTIATLLISSTTAPSEDSAQSELFALIGEARALAQESGETIWPGFSEAPDTILLISGEEEILLCHEGPAAGFTELASDPVTGCSQSVRTRVFPPNLLASFPAIDGVPSIVVGTPEATSRTPDAWMVTLVHEHMHQMQDAVPGQYQDLLALGLDGGDQSGMWMLNYPFPYADHQTAAEARSLADRALDALEESDPLLFHTKVRAYLTQRTLFLDSVSPGDRRYYELQVWKEGVARWTELAVTRASGMTNPHHANLAGQQIVRMRDELAALDLHQAGRVAFYALGSAEAEMLERLDTGWRRTYWLSPFDLGAVFDAIIPDAPPAASSD